MTDHIEVLRGMLESTVWCGSPEDRDALQAAIRAIESLRGGGVKPVAYLCEWPPAADGLPVRGVFMTPPAKAPINDKCKVTPLYTTPELPEGEAWRSIRCAPKDGKTLLLFCDERTGDRYLGLRPIDCPDDGACNTAGIACYPTHWQSVAEPRRPVVNPTPRLA